MPGERTDIAGRLVRLRDVAERRPLGRVQTGRKTVVRHCARKVFQELGDRVRGALPTGWSRCGRHPVGRAPSFLEQQGEYSGPRRWRGMYNYRERSDPTASAAGASRLRAKFKSTK